MPLICFVNKFETNIKLSQIWRVFLPEGPLPCLQAGYNISSAEVYILIDPIISGKPLNLNNCVFEDAISLWKNKNGIAVSLIQFCFSLLECHLSEQSSIMGLTVALARS